MTLPRPSQLRALKAWERDHLEFDFDHHSPLLLPSEVAEEWDYSVQHVLDMIEEGLLFAFTVNASDQPRHAHYRILRRAAVRGVRLTDAGRSELIQTVDAWLYHPVQIGGKKNLTVNNCKDTLRISARHVRQLWELQQFKAPNLGLGGKEVSLRIPRAQLTAFVQRRLQMNHQL